MTTRRVAFFAISLSLSLGLTLAFAANPRKNVVRPKTTYRTSMSAGRPMRLLDRRAGNLPTREQLVEQATLAFRNKPYQGTSIKPNLRATGDSLEFQRKIATLITKADFLPQARLDQFTWLKQHPEIRINGWTGLIQSVTPTSGGWSVRVAVRPDLDHMGEMRMIFTGDCFFETYLFDGQNIRYVAGESPPVVGQSLIVD
ncbi:hypothetical protein V5E97_10465 [Singulisphaera sp. Ch08]|uniref:Uncharacterized protein n=1 Tax=Singulisphaera sp. Ch08 TaxID=3120278 RepID=A0AAU7CM87_9BACT